MNYFVFGLKLLTPQMDTFVLGLLTGKNSIFHNLLVLERTQLATLEIIMQDQVLYLQLLFRKGLDSEKTI